MESRGRCQGLNVDGGKMRPNELQWEVDRPLRCWLWKIHFPAQFLFPKGQCQKCPDGPLMRFWCSHCMRATYVVISCCSHLKRMKVLFVRYTFLNNVSFYAWQFVLICTSANNSSEVLKQREVKVLMYWLHARGVGKGRQKEEQVQAKWYSRSSFCTYSCIHIQFTTRCTCRLDTYMQQGEFAKVRF